MIRTPQIFHVWQPSTHREGHCATSLKMNDGNCMKCAEMHETQIFQFPIPPQSIERVGGKVQK